MNYLFWRLLALPALPMTALFALTMAFLDCDGAWARAGGGGSFSGGGGGGGSFGGGHSSGSGGDDGALFLILYMLIRFLIVLCIEHPFVGIPLTLGLLFLAYHAARTVRTAHSGYVIRNGRTARTRFTVEQIVDALQKKDPDFDLTTFQSRARTAFTTAQDAWCEQDLTRLRPFVCDGVYERWSMQVDELRESGWRDHMENLKIELVQLADYSALGSAEELTVFFRASAVDYRISLAENRPARDASTLSEAFGEYWTFIRRQGCRSLRGKLGLMEGRCPNCGHPVGINQSAKCESCGSFLRSGEFDWVLSEITQQSVYRPAPRQNQPGLSNLLQRDPDFTPQLVEDRAAVAYWHWQKALRERTADALRGSALPELVSTLDEAGKGQAFYRECAVGAVNLQGVLCEPELDHALLEVVWSGEKVTRNAGGGEHTAQKALCRTLLVFDRAGTTRSTTQRTVGSAHCPACGAPEEADGKGCCNYCGQPLNSLKTSWLLAAICEWDSEAASRWLEQLEASSLAVEPDKFSDDNFISSISGQIGFSPGAYAVVAWMVELIASDREVTQDERNLLIRAAAVRHIPQTVVENMLAAAEAGQFQPPEPTKKENALEWLQGMARMALADGKISAPELKLLQMMSEKCGYTDYDLQMLLKKERGALYRQARDDIRQTQQMLRKKKEKA